MTNEELQGLVEGISWEYFKRKFEHKASFNPRLRTTGGRYLLSTHNIEINKTYYEVMGLEELIGIIKHELCHYHLHLLNRGYQHKDADFKILLKSVGGPRFCSSLPIEMKKGKAKRVLIYSCVSCKQKYTRKKRMDINKYVCGKCRGRLKLEEIISIDK
ncbi:SprT family protein [Niallia sp. FSL W8-0635]|uniref:SprT family protein n=1 Tax=Niallia sp. FSL W8-0635 TaxID=2975337 RepID=UPI002B049106|nr:SprT family protein [Yersinia enterocolitica]